MEMHFELMFEDCNEKYSETLLNDFTTLVENEFGEHFDIQYSLRLERNKLFAYLSLNRNYLTNTMMKKLIRVTKKISVLIKPNKVFGDFDLTIDALTREKNSIFWLNIFNPIKVKEIGEGKLLSAPVYKVEKLDGGYVLLILYKDPWTCDGDKNQEVREKVRRYLSG